MQMKRDMGKWGDRWEDGDEGQKDKDKCGGERRRLRDRDRMGVGEAEMYDNEKHKGWREYMEV